MIMVEFDRANNPHRPAGHYYQPHHGSPHLQHLDRPSAHSTPSPPHQYATLPHIGVPQQASAVRATPTSYPSPASYPSPSMSAYQYPQQSQPPTSRGSGSPYSQPTTINLPPIRLNPPQAQLPPPSHEGSPLLGSPLPPPQGMHTYYPQLPPSAHSHAHITSSPVHQPLRYPLPAGHHAEGRIMSGGRHKKEIKRRTKTGCLTCRKRRIKCDEGHPTCKNCQKSKRDCLGYDPIFKSQPGPAAIQPAPSSGGSGHNSVSPALSTASSPTSSCDTYNDYGPLDPALDATSHPHISAPSSLLDSPATYRPELKRTLDRTSPFSSASDTTGRPPYTPIPRSVTPGGMVRPDMQGGNSAKRIKIDDLLTAGGATSQPLSPPTSELAVAAFPISGPTSEKVDMVKRVYKENYAPALDAFLEVGWFSSKGQQKMWSDAPLAEVMADVFARLKARGGSYVEEEDPAIIKSGWDADLLWAAVKTCYGTRIPISDNRGDSGGSGDPEGAEALRRIHIIEVLLAGSSEYAPPSPKYTSSTDSESGPERFWNLLDEISRFKITGPETKKKLDDLVEECASYINGKQNRSLLCAIAELKHLHDHQESSMVHKNNIHQYITRIAEDDTQHVTNLGRRIAGRAMGLWGLPKMDAPFCMPRTPTE
ncbi:hypothetical protein EDC01DRAFT_620471 [Geopyxis carbonaria]|nr:hypothetical protein EDC01DRAFT_620471 [Geopyxis carbonaria]